METVLYLGVILNISNHKISFGTLLEEEYFGKWLYMKNTKFFRIFFVFFFYKNIYFIGDSMSLINVFRSYLLDEEFKITIIENKIDIVNYDEIGHFDSNKVIIRYKDKRLIIKGNNLVVSRLLVDEVLVTGNIKNIEFI